jgi:glyoxylase-like metal-dependent hydrolase (beta-lactamase superfamily II)
MVLLDAIARRLPGALAEGSGENESFSAALDGGLEYPHYTRPVEFRGWSVPDVLLSGDHVLPTITPHISGLIEGDPLRAYLDSLDRVAAFEGVTVVLPAHGHPFTDLPGRVDDIKEHHAERLEALRAASHDQGWATVNDLMRALFKPRSWSHMAESETYAHLEHLRLLGEADRREEAGLAHYLVP